MGLSGRPLLVLGHAQRLLERAEEEEIWTPPTRRCSRAAVSEESSDAYTGEASQRWERRLTGWRAEVEVEGVLCCACRRLTRSSSCTPQHEGKRVRQRTHSLLCVCRVWCWWVHEVVWCGVVCSAVRCGGVVGSTGGRSEFGSKVSEGIDIDLAQLEGRGGRG